MSLLIGGLIMGFALGWGSWWYVAERSKESEGRSLFQSFWGARRRERRRKLAERTRALKTPRVVADEASNIRLNSPVLGEDSNILDENWIDDDAADLDVERDNRPVELELGLGEESTIADVVEPEHAVGVVDDRSAGGPHDPPNGMVAIEPDVEASDESAARHAVVIIAYCVRCRVKREMQNPEAARARNGSAGYRGICSVCGARMFALTGR